MNLIPHAFWTSAQLNHLVLILHSLQYRHLVLGILQELNHILPFLLRKYSLIWPIQSVKLQSHHFLFEVFV